MHILWHAIINTLLSIILQWGVIIILWKKVDQITSQWNDTLGIYGEIVGRAEEGSQEPKEEKTEWRFPTLPAIFSDIQEGTEEHSNNI